jgi:hypothetical protein
VPAINGGGGCSGSGEEEGVVHGRVKGRPQGLWGRFYSARKARRGDGWSNGHQWPWGPAASRHSRGGNLIGAETVGIDDRGVKLVLQCALMEA